MIKKNINISELVSIFKRYKENYNPIINDFSKIYIYEINNEIVGFVLFSIMYEKCEIIDIFVDEKERRKGIARSLIEEIINDFDIENITLEVSNNNISAINLYEKLGFIKVATRKNYYEDSDGILMLKEIR